MNADNNSNITVSTKHYSFIRSFLGTCCGTTIFVVLGRHRLWRVLLHLFLLALLISVPVTWFVSKRVAPEFSAAREIFVSTFGKEIVFNTETRGFQPSLNPETYRVAAFPGLGKIFYYPSAPEKLPDNSAYADLACFAVWSPGNISVAYRADNQWMVNSFNSSGVSFAVSSEPADLFKTISAVPGGKTVQLSSSRLFEEIFFAYKMRVFITHALALFVLPLIYSLILLGVLRFTFARVTAPDYFTWWKCGVYAAFPGALIASAITAFDLPLISFTTAYMLASMIYGLHAVMRVEYEKSGSKEFDDGKYGEE